MTKSVTRLYTTFQPQHYVLRLDPDRDTKKLSGTVTITGKKVGRPSQRLTFHQKDLKVTKATIVRHDKKGDQTFTVVRINQQKSLEEVRLHADTLLYPGQYTVTMEFTGKVQPGMNGVYYSNYKQGGKTRTMVSTQFESHYARLAFPCIDEPEAKATFDLTLVTPEGEAALANMPATSSKTENGKTVTTFATSPKMSTYLLAFAYGDLQYKETKTENGVDVRVWSTKAHPLDNLDFALKIAKHSVEFFDEYYGVPYPLPKLEHVAIPDFSAGAMENWGLVTYREMALLADPVNTPQTSKDYIATAIAHETAHQWFGDLVTMRWWDDLWLNESFATVMQYVAVDSVFPDWHVWNSFVAEESLASVRRDSIAGVQAIKTTVRHPDEIGTLFDPSIVYAKGSRILNMLMNYLGQDDFRKGLKLYFKKHAYSNTTGDDLWAAFAAASKKDVAAFMEPWISCSGFPVINVQQDGTALNISQKHFLLDMNKTDAERLWPVPLLGSAAEIPALLSDREVHVTLTKNDFVRVNQGAKGHYIVHYANPEHVASLAKQVEHKTLSESERLILLSDSSLLSRAGLQPFAETMKLLEHYKQEDSEPVWDIMSLILADVRRFVDSNPDIEPGIKAYIRKLIESQYKRLGWEHTAQESVHDTKLRAIIIGLGVYADHPEIVARALELFTAFKAKDAQLEPELRSIILGTAVREHIEGAFTYLLNLDESSEDLDLKNDIMGALSMTRLPEEVDILLGRIKDPAKVRQHDVLRWVFSLLRSRYSRPQSWPWLRNNWDWIRETFGGDMHYDSFPRYAANAFSTPQLLKEYREFFTPLQKEPALTRNIAMGIEELENRTAWLARDHDAITAFFKR